METVVTCDEPEGGFCRIRIHPAASGRMQRTAEDENPPIAN